MLVVPAMNYSLLLTRSVDFAPFASVLYPAYPDELTRPLLMSLIQTLWDRGDPDGYAWHMTDDPYPNTPSHTVLLHMAVGDHQVANVATEVEARTIGAKLRLPAVDPGRSTEVEPFSGSSRSRSTRSRAARSSSGTSARCAAAWALPRRRSPIRPRRWGWTRTA